MASATASTIQDGTTQFGRPHRKGGLLEDERWFATALLFPTAVLLGLFIAYPFFEGIWLALTNTRVGVPGEFVGLKNFEKHGQRLQLLVS